MQQGRDVASNFWHVRRNRDECGVLSAGPGTGRRYRRRRIEREDRVLSGRAAPGNTVAAQLPPYRARRGHSLRGIGARATTSPLLPRPPTSTGRRQSHSRSCRPPSAGAALRRRQFRRLATRMAAAQRHAPTPPPNLIGLRHHRGQRLLTSGILGGGQLGSWGPRAGLRRACPRRLPRSTSTAARIRARKTSSAPSRSSECRKSDRLAPLTRGNRPIPSPRPARVGVPRATTPSPIMRPRLRRAAGPRSRRTCRPRQQRRRFRQGSTSRGPLVDGGFEFALLGPWSARIEDCTTIWAR